MYYVVKFNEFLLRLFLIIVVIYKELTMLMIKRLTLADAKIYKMLLSDTELAQTAGFIAVDNEIMLDMLFLSTIKNDITYLILENNKLLGSVSFSRSLDFNGYEVGYMLKKQYRNQKIMSTFFPQAIRLFKELGRTANLFAKVREANLSSKKILLNNEFILKETTLIDQELIQIYQKNLQ